MYIELTTYYDLSDSCITKTTKIYMYLTDTFIYTWHIYFTSLMMTQTYLSERPVWWYTCRHTPCCCMVIRPRDGECWHHNSGPMVDPSLVILSVDVTGTDRPYLSSVLFWFYHHTPGCVTAGQYRLHMALVLILMDVLCRRNDVFLHALSPLQHQTDSGCQTPRHPHCCSLLYS